jgi:GT2 family glycosyltransferase
MTATLEQARTQRETGDPRVGVSILTYNRADEVSRTVERMLALPERPQIVVVDNGSTDGTPDLLRRRFPGVRCVVQSGNPGGAGRNAGLAALDAPYVALCDDDTWWEPGSLGRAADLFDAYPRLAIITGRVLVGPDNRLDPTCELMAASPVRPRTALPGPALVGFLAGASLVRRSAFLQAGGFERRFFIGGEEELLTLDLLAAGWELAYADALVVHHHPSQENRDDSARRRTVVRNQLWVAWLRYPLGWALTKTARVVSAARIDPISRAALVAALRELPWALAHRRVIPRDVQRRLRQLGPV